MGYRLKLTKLEFKFQLDFSAFFLISRAIKSANTSEITIEFNIIPKFNVGRRKAKRLMQSVKEQIL